MRKTASTTEPPLIERLRQSKSTAKTRFIARWPEIREALEAGFTAKAIHDELTKEGLQISYRRFVELVTELRAPAGPPPQAAAPSAARKPDSVRDQGVIKTASATIKKYHHNPHPNEDELI